MDTTNANAPHNGKTAGTSKVARYVVAAIGAVLIAFCGWSMSEYVQGRDPLAFALGSDALQTTAEAKDEAQAKKDEKAEAKLQKSDGDKADSAKSSKKSSSKDSAKSSAKKKGNGTSQQNATSKNNGESEHENAGQRESDAADGTVTQEVVYYEDEADAPAQQGSQQEYTQPTQDEEQSEAAQVITISLSVDGGAGASSATLELQPGSTALDALYAAGVGVDSISNPFGAGTWVTSIGGLAEEAGHGWTYRVNGDLPGVMSDLYVLSDGDQLLWQYV